MSVEQLRREFRSDAVRRVSGAVITDDWIPTVLEILRIAESGRLTRETVVAAPSGKVFPALTIIRHLHIEHLVPELNRLAPA